MAEGDNDLKHFEIGSGADETTTMQVVHSFPHEGVAEIVCNDFGASNVQAFHLKITAIHVGEIQNVQH